MALTKPNIEIVRVDQDKQPVGNIEYNDANLDVQQGSSAGKNDITKMEYDDQSGILSIHLSTGIILKAKGLPVLSDIPKGQRGLRGLPGSPGKDGRDGIPGEKGEGGCQGSIGSQGAQGEKGSVGDPGSIGPTGDMGEQGIRGPVGEPGDRGLIGPKGAHGDSGRDGLNATVRIVVSATDPGTAGGPSCIWVRP
jgi:hypothetical protein